MQNQTILPRVGELLRSLITHGGYRQYITERGLDKNLDNLAIENLPSSACDCVNEIEDACTIALVEDIGQEWAQFLMASCWPRTREAIQQLALAVDTTVIADEQGLSEINRVFIVPMLTGFSRLAEAQISGPKLDEEWWESPFRAWVRWVSAETGIGQQQVLDSIANHADVDNRTIARWREGKAIQELHWPFRPIVSAGIGSLGQSVPYRLLDKMSVWLIIAVAYQSLPSEQRNALRDHANERNRQAWSIEWAIERLNTLGYSTGAPSIKEHYLPILDQIEQLFSVWPLDHQAIHAELSAFQALTSAETGPRRRFYQYLYDRLAARLYALTGEQKKATDFYDKAVNGAWWQAGANQKAILEEALLYVVGVGDMVAAKNYWDKTFMLRLNRLPKRELDEMERRRLAYGFERMFYPQQAKDRVLLGIECVSKDYELDPRALSAPNRKVKHAGGRTRRTPLMDAILLGTLQDVQQLLSAGGDPNDYIKESGEGPLSYAMRRACDRKDPAIMQDLLKLPLTKATVNRPASTKRETPMKIAIEMADARAVARLIELGADIETECGQLPSALCYAVNLFYESIRKDMTQIAAYFSGQGRADVYDAKDGAVLDIDLAQRRQTQLATMQSSARGQAIWENEMDYFIRPAEAHKEVIRVLLSHGADANRRYRVNCEDIAEWTPTLFAAEIGDLDVFRMLVENGGDPSLTLSASSSPFEQHDALWVAISHDRRSIVDYLATRRAQ